MSRTFTGNVHTTAAIYWSNRSLGQCRTVKTRAVHEVVSRRITVQP